MITSTNVPSFVVDMYSRAINTLRRKPDCLECAIRMYGNNSRARHETAGWTKENLSMLNDARATLAKICVNCPEGLTMVDVKSAWLVSEAA